jgi:hypothetical protein
LFTTNIQERCEGAERSFIVLRDLRVLRGDFA